MALKKDKISFIPETKSLKALQLKFSTSITKFTSFEKMHNMQQFDSVSRGDLSNTTLLLREGADACAHDYNSFMSQR